MNNPFEYHLVMQNDTNTKGYNQWFYFSVEGMKSGQAYTIRIVNFVKILLIKARKRNIRSSQRE